MNEDVMWERLKDVQREVENSRLQQTRLIPAIWRSARLLGSRAWPVRGAARRTAKRLA